MLRFDYCIDEENKIVNVTVVSEKEKKEGESGLAHSLAGKLVLTMEEWARIYTAIMKMDDNKLHQFPYFKFEVKTRK